MRVFLSNHTNLLHRNPVFAFQSMQINWQLVYFHNWRQYLNTFHVMIIVAQLMTQVMDSFVCSFVRSFIDLFACLFVYLFVCLIFL